MDLFRCLDLIGVVCWMEFALSMIDFREFLSFVFCWVNFSTRDLDEDAASPRGVITSSSSALASAGEISSEGNREDSLIADPV